MEKIQKSFATLSVNRRRIADYIVSDGTTVSFASLRQLAQMVGVSEFSIVRFAQDLGYTGYPELRRQLQQEVKDRLGSAARMRQTIQKVRGREALVRDLFQKDIDLIGETLAALSYDDFERAIDLIWKARRVFIIGLRSSCSMAYFLYFRFVRLQIDARLITVTGSSSLFEQLALLRKEDLLIAIGFSDIPRETDTAIDHAIVQSLTAPFCLSNALAIGVATANKSKSLEALSQLDSMAAVYGGKWDGRKPRGKAKP